MKVPSIYFVIPMMICFSYSKNLWGQLDSVHYLPPLNGNIETNASQYIYLSTPETTPFQVKISDGSGTILAMPSISKTASFIYSVGTGINSTMMVTANQLNDVLSNKGIKVVGPKKFFCDFRARVTGHAGAMTAKGRAALGTTFRLGNMPQTDDGAHVASVMATENNTIVTFSNFAPGIKLREGGSSFIPLSSFNVTLDAGETYVIAMYGSNNTDPQMFNGFFGVLINSTNPIAVNCASWFASPVGITSTVGDFGFDQIVPLSKVGTEYIVMQGKGPAILEIPIVVAHYDDTKVYLHSNSTPYAILNAGGRIEIPKSQFINGCMYIRTDKKVFVYQALGGGSSYKNGELTFIPPLSCQSASCIDNISNINFIGTTNYIIQFYILAANGANVTVNTTAGPPPTLSGPFNVSGNPDYVLYTASNIQGHATVCSNGPIQVSVAAVDNNAGWGGYYSGYEKIFVPEVKVVPNAQCPDTLFLKKKYINSGITWYKDGLVFNPANDSIVAVNQPGNYMVIGKFTTFCGDILADTSYYTVPDAFPAYQVNITNAPCFGSFGQVNITPNDPTATYTYIWSNNQTGPVQNLPAGQYTVTVATTSNCKLSTVVTVEEPAQLQLQTSPNIQKCPENTATISASGNFINYLWTDGTQGPSLTVQSPGTYSVTATNLNGCTIANSITVSDYPSPNAEISGSPIVCPGSSSLLSAPSGPGYSYQWSVPNGSSQTIEVLPGTYMITVTDGNLCSSTDTFEITQVPGPVASINSNKDTLCKPETLLLKVSSDHPIISIDWIPVNQSSAQIVISDGGLYSAIIEDNNGCRDTATYLITAYEQVTPIVIGNLGICPSQENTELTVSGQNISDIEWSFQQQTGPSITVSAAGTYAVTVTYDYGCTATNAVQVFEFPLPEPKIQAPNFICENGKAVLSVAGSFPLYIWSTNDTVNSINVPAGIYGLTVTDVNGCTGSDTVTISQIPLYHISLNGPTYTCKGNPVILQVSTVAAAPGGTVWLSTTSNQKSQSIISQGIAEWQVYLPYTSTVRIDSLIIPGYDCPFEGLPAEITVEVDQIEVLALANIVDNGYNLLCKGDTNAQISALAQNGQPPYSYIWSNGVTSGSMIHNLPAGNYSVTVTGSNGCTNVAEVPVVEPNGLIVEISATAPPCYGIDNGIITFQVISTQGNVSVEIDGGNPIAIPLTLTELAPNIYDIRVSDNYCSLDTTIIFVEPTHYFIDVLEDAPVRLKKYDSYQFKTITNASLKSIVYSPGKYFDDSDSTILRPKVTPYENVNYTIYAYTQDGGCLLTDNLLIQVEKEQVVFVPNIFSPNDDGKNDKCLVFAKEGAVRRIKKFQIFDRWGGQVFSKEDFMPNNPVYGWDGRLNGVLVNPEVFVWHLEIEYMDGKTEILKGDVTVVR